MPYKSESDASSLLPTYYLKNVILTKDNEYKLLFLLLFTLHQDLILSLTKT